MGTIIRVSLMSALGLTAAAAYPPWAVKTDGPLLSRFAKDVTPDTAWREHPRPGLVRDESSWGSLNGLWQFDRFSPDLSSPPLDTSKQLPEQILVPFCAESAIGGVRNYSKSFSYWYRREFDSPKPAPPRLSGRVLLHFEAADWNTTVFLNGQQLNPIDTLTHAPTNLTSHIGGYDAFAFDVTDALRPAANGSNVLVVGVYDDTRQHGHSEQQMAGKQSGTAFENPSGIFYTGTSGIWQTVWLEQVPSSYITSVYPVAELKGTRARVLFDVGFKLAPGSGGSGRGADAAAAATVSVVVHGADGKAVASASSALGSLGPGRFLPVVMPSAASPAGPLRLWTPDGENDTHSHARAHAHARTR
jgi:hypothetical protein